VISIRARKCDRKHFKLSVRQMADPLSPGRKGPCARRQRDGVGLRKSYQVYIAMLSLSSSLAIFSRKHGGTSSRSGRKTLASRELAEGPLAAVPMKTAAAAGRRRDKNIEQEPRPRAGALAVSACSRPDPTSAGRSTRSDRWFRSGSSIVVKC